MSSKLQRFFDSSTWGGQPPIKNDASSFHATIREIRPIREQFFQGKEILIKSTKVQVLYRFETKNQMTRFDPWQIDQNKRNLIHPVSSKLSNKSLK